MNLNELSKTALGAAMRTGTDGWGQMGSSTDHARYAEPRPKRPGRPKMCHCGCEQKKTHVGKANGMALASGCHMSILRWVKTGHTRAAMGAPQ